MRVLLPSLGVAALLFSSFVPFVSGQSEDRPAPPDRAVVEVYRVEQFDPEGRQYEVFFNLTFTLSAQDADQTTGALEYNLWQRPDEGDAAALAAAGLSNCTVDPCRFLQNLTTTPIPGRLGWVYTTVQYAIGTNGDDRPPSLFTLFLTANNTAAQESVVGCGVQINFRSNRSQAQCGPNIAAPPGVAAIVETQATDEVPSRTDVRWRLSEDDPDIVNGSFQYWVFNKLVADTSAVPFLPVGCHASGPLFEGAQATEYPFACWNVTDVTVSVFSPGILNMSVNTDAAPAGTVSQYLRVQARDYATHQRSNFSCVAFVTGGELYSKGACGVMPVPEGGFPPIGERQFPGLNVTLIAEQSGVAPGVIGGMLGVSVVIGLAAAGFAAGGMALAGVVGVAGYGFIAALGLVPDWTLVIAFLCFLSFIVLSLKGR